MEPPPEIPENYEQYSVVRFMMPYIVPPSAMRDQSGLMALFQT